MICALMIATMHFSSSEAIEYSSPPPALCFCNNLNRYYGNKRSVDTSRTVETVSCPSQRNMLEVFEQSLRMEFVASVTRVMIGMVISSSIIGIDCLNPVVAIYQQNSLLHCILPKKGRSADTGVCVCEYVCVCV